MPKYILFLLLLNIIDTDVIIAQNLNDTLGVTITVRSEQPQDSISFAVMRNPFSPITGFIMSLKEDSLVEVRILDTNNNLIAIILSGNMKPGNYDILYNPLKFSSGKYYLTMSANNYLKTDTYFLLK